MEDQSKRFALNATDLVKLAKSVGIATGGFAAVFYLAVFDLIDIDVMTGLYTAIGSVAVNAVIKFLQGPTESK